MQAPMDRRIVVIEDDLDNLELIMSLLREDVGVQDCIGWSSGVLFFRWLRDASLIPHDQRPRPIDVILLDIQIPRENGYELIRQIRQDALLSATRVVAVTANVMAADLERAQCSGFDGFLGKPISVRRFPGQMMRIIAGEAVWEPR